jgi:hypothetical protein
MNTIRTRIQLEEITHLARDERQRQELEAADRRDSIVGWVCCIGLVVFVIIEITGRFA